MAKSRKQQGPKSHGMPPCGKAPQSGHSTGRRRKIEVRRVDQCETLDELFTHCLPAFGGAGLRRVYSILDQAIASSTGKLTADSVRDLVGAAPAHILEQVMQSVSEGRSDEILRQVDHLISEGHSPTHFTRQMVRFLRNATVAKIAGKDSPLLQISSEERERVARISELFEEEDLTRHLHDLLGSHVVDLI